MSSAIKTFLFSILALFFSFLFILLLGEIFIYWAAPQACMLPRPMFSPEYGQITFANTKIRHTKPRHFDFTYTTNELHHRGAYFPPAPAPEKKTVIVLGDSYGFGIGVQDGDDFAARLNENLGAQFRVVNLAMGSWGLTQEIKRYYDLGEKYAPQAVILQFCFNDPADNLKQPVTRIENGKFIFQDNPNSIHQIKKYLSTSPLQNSQLYNFIRQSAFLILDRLSDKAASNQREETAYNELIELFAQSLSQKGIRLIFITAQNEVDRFPLIKTKIKDLEGQGLLSFYDSADWFLNQGDVSSPEGHKWGARAHQIIAEQLSGILKKS